MQDSKPTDQATKFESVQEAAEFFSRPFDLRTRPDGSRFWALQDSHVMLDEDGGTLQELVVAAHDDREWLPDDTRYEYLVSALDILEDVEDDDSAGDEYSERLDSDVDVYTSELTTWLGSHGKRLAYLDEVLDPNSIWAKPETGSELLHHAQYLERYEVFEAVRAFLAELVEASE